MSIALSAGSDTRRIDVIFVIFERTGKLCLWNDKYYPNGALSNL